MKLQASASFRHAVRSLNILQRGSDGTSASVTYYQCSHARDSVIRLSDETWDGRRIIVSPASTRTSVHASTQNCKLKVQWFLTESECRGKVQCTNHESAEKILQLLESQFKCQCYLKFNSDKPMIKCQWSTAPHTGMAIVEFSTEQAAQEVNRMST